MQRRLSEELVTRLETPEGGERTVWCAALPRFGLRLRSGGGKTFVIKYRDHDGRQRKMTLGNWPALGVADARKLARAKLGHVEQGRDPAAEAQAERHAQSMRQLADAYLEAKSGKKRPRTLATDRSMFDNIILPVLGAHRVKNVTGRQIEDLHRSLKGTPYRANRVLALLSNAFNLAVRWGWRSDNPAKGIERYPERPRERYLKPDELARLSEALSSHPNRRAANAVRLLLLTGARRTEVLAAAWDQFDLEAGLWVKPSSHTKQRREHRVPLSGPARVLLAELREEAERVGHGSPYVFPGDALDKPLGDISGFWERLREEIGLPDVRLHDLRHQYASILASAGMSLPVIGRLLGHTQPITTSRYAHLFDDPLRAATEHVAEALEIAASRTYPSRS